MAGKRTPTGWGRPALLNIWTAVEDSRYKGAEMVTQVVTFWVLIAEELAPLDQN
jgi:hypothetical protein